MATKKSLASGFGSALLFLALFSVGVDAQLPPLPDAPLGPMPAPPENPYDPQNPMHVAKATLGKILFWEEQLSSDNGVACGTCHQGAAGGSDPRIGLEISRHPGFDGQFFSVDDVVGSIGVVAMDENCNPVDDGVFFPERQVTGRRTPSFIGAGYVLHSFWDGRATDEFVDPENPGTVLIPTGGAMESQAVGPILSAVEMACSDRTWDDVRNKLLTVDPMALATDIPQDMADAIAANPTYPQLFTAAFGTPDINAGRIGFAIATYERTLVPDQTVFDLHLAGFDVLTPQEQEGLDLFQEHCMVCHSGAELADHSFRDIGLRPVQEDLGRGAITGDPLDDGKFKVPSLRNVALRAPFFHTGGKADLDGVLSFYNGGGDFPMNPNFDPDMVELNLPNEQLISIKIFMENTLTDARVAGEMFPFDRPTLQTYFRRGDANQDMTVNVADAVTLLDHLFGTDTPFLECEDAGDANDDGVLDVADPISILGRLFSGDPPLPLPRDDSFGPDPTLDPLGC